jgi:hypothetical protein
MSTAQISTIHNLGEKPLYLLPHLAGYANISTEHHLGRKALYPLRRLAGMGQDAGDFSQACVYLSADGSTVESVDFNSSPDECAANGGNWQTPPAGTSAAIAAPAPPSLPPTLSAPSAAVGVPVGTQISYQANFTAPSNPLRSSFYSVSNVIAAVAANLQQWGIQVISQSGSGTLVGTPTAQLRLQITNPGGYGQLLDVKSIIDGAFYNAAGATVTSSQIAVIGASASGAIGAPNQNPDLTSWFEENAALIGFGVLALVFGSIVLKKL